MHEQRRIEEKLKNFTKSAYNWLESNYYAQYPNLFLWAPICIGAGIYIYFSMSTEPPIFIFIFGAILLLCTYKFFIEKTTHEPILLFFLAFVLIFAGIGCGALRTYIVAAPMLTKDTKSIVVIGTIESIELLETAKGARIILNDLDIPQIQKDETPKKIRLTVRKYQNLRVKQRIRTRAQLKEPSAPLHPDGFHFRRYLFFQGIGATGFIYSAPEILLDTQAQLFSFPQLRFDIAQHLSESMNEKQSGIAIALITGFKNKISKLDYESIRNAGLAHMLAISGLHIGLISGAVFFFLRFILVLIPFVGLHWPIKSIAALAAIFAALFYMLLAGATPPTQRAFIMSAIFFFAIIINRSPISLRLVALAALIILILRPESLINVSFQMSFAAVTTLVYFYDRTRNFWQRAYQKTGIINKLCLYCLSLCLTTFIASIATAPFALYHFGQISAFGSIANLIAVPILSFWIMPAALCALITMPLQLDQIFLNLMGMGIEAILHIAHWANTLPHATFHNAQISTSSFTLMIIASLCFLILRGSLRFGLSAGAFMLAAFVVTKSDHAKMLISANHKIIAYHDQHQNIYSSETRKERFTLENWERYWGGDLGEAKTIKEQASCDEEGCRITLDNFKISVIRAPYIYAQECVWADVILSEKPINDKECPNKIIIDKYDTHQNGYYALELKNNKINVKNNSQSEKNRPWSLYPRYKKKHS